MASATTTTATIDHGRHNSRDYHCGNYWCGGHRYRYNPNSGRGRSCCNYYYGW